MDFIRGLGTRYLGLFVGASLVLLLSGLLQTFIAWGVGSLVIAFAAATWTFLSLFALIGATIFARREIFAIPGIAESKPDRKARWAQQDRFCEWQRSLDIVYQNWRSGQQKEAHAELQKLIRQEHNSIEVFAWLFENTLDWEDKQCALAIGRQFVRRLLGEDNETQALSVVLRCRRFSSELSLAPGDAARLSNHARNNGQLGLADELASWER